MAELQQLGLSINDVARMFGIDRTSVKPWLVELSPLHRAIVIYLMTVIDDELNREDGKLLDLAWAVEDAIRQWLRDHGRDGR